MDSNMNENEIFTEEFRSSLRATLRSAFLDGYYGHPARRWSEMPQDLQNECLSDPRTGHIFRKLFGKDDQP